MIHSRTLDDVTLLTIDRPDRRNALDLDHCVALHRAVDDAVAAGARVLVLRSEEHTSELQSLA